MTPAILITRFFTDNQMRIYVMTALAAVIVVVSLPALAVFSLGSETITFLDQTSSIEAAESQGFYLGGLVTGDTYTWGNCTYWAFAMRLWANKPIPSNWGNANTWDDNAARDGYVVDHNPKVGAVMQTDEGGYGHVAYVTEVDVKTGKWTISEMNAPKLNVVSSRIFTANLAKDYDFIHDKKVAKP